MKKAIISFLAIILFAMPVSAQDIEKDYSYKVDDIVSEYNIDFDNLKDYPFETIWGIVKTQLKNNFIFPYSYLYKIISILLITAFINFFNFDSNKEISQLINTVAMLLMFYSVYEFFNEMMINVSAMLNNVKNFMLTFIPVFGGITFASGEMITSSIYTGFFLITIVTLADVCVSYIIPSLNLYIALGVTSGISSVINLKPICEFYSKSVKIVMTAAVTVLGFLLSLQNIISQSKDGFVLKAGKMFVTSVVPIIGSSLESAVGSVYASMGILKGFCGLAGITVILAIFLPNIFTLSVNWLCFQIMSVTGEILENKWVKNILDCFKDVIEILLSMCVLFMVFLVFSLTVMIKSVGAG